MIKKFKNLFEKPKETNINSINYINSITRNRTNEFKSIRNPISHSLNLEKSRLQCRLEKLIQIYQTTSYTNLFFNKTKLEQEIIYWESNNKCYLCWKKSKDNCRLCGFPICNYCTREIPLKEIKKKIKGSIIVCKELCFKLIINTKYK